MWSAAGLLAIKQFHTAVFKFLAVLSSNLHVTRASHSQSHLQFWMVVPPMKPSMPGRPALNWDDWGALAKICDGVAVMTYDAASPDKPGPNAPLDWMRSNLDAMLPAEHPYSPYGPCYCFINDFILLMVSTACTTMLRARPQVRLLESFSSTAQACLPSKLVA